MKRSFLDCLLVGCFVIGSAFASDVSIKEDLTITIYNQDRALVKDIRTVDLKLGENEFSFSDISDEILPETVLLSGKGLSVLEQNFNFHLLTHENMMQKAVGTTVDVEFINPATGEITTQRAELLAYNGGHPVLKIGNRIETALPGRVVFNRVPESLFSKPTLIFKALSDKTGKETLELSYLTQGLSWKADYVAELNSDETKLDINGLVTLTNRTAVSYKNAELQLVAGDLNLNKRYKNYDDMGARSLAAGNAFASDMMEAESVSGYYLYTLGRPTDIMARQKKQVSLLSGQNVSVGRRYIYRGMNVEEKENPSIEISFENEKDNGLGMPLPKGTVRVYKKDARGKLIFVGEDSIPHTAKKQDVKLVLGKDFDITAEKKVLEKNRISKDVTEFSVEIAISNAKIVPVDVYVYEHINGETWKVLSENFPSQKENANTLMWKVPVKAEGKTVLTFKMQSVH